MDDRKLLKQKTKSNLDRIRRLLNDVENSSPLNDGALALGYLFSQMTLEEMVSGKLCPEEILKLYKELRSKQIKSIN